MSHPLGHLPEHLVSHLLQLLVSRRPLQRHFDVLVRLLVALELHPGDSPAHQDLDVLWVLGQGQSAVLDGPVVELQLQLRSGAVGQGRSLGCQRNGLVVGLDTLLVLPGLEELVSLFLLPLGHELHLSSVEPLLDDLGDTGAPCLARNAVADRGNLLVRPPRSLLLPERPELRLPRGEFLSGFAQLYLGLPLRHLLVVREGPASHLVQPDPGSVRRAREALVPHVLLQPTQLGDVGDGLDLVESDRVELFLLLHARGSTLLDLHLRRR